jgi:hypothetical protein
LEGVGEAFEEFLSGIQNLTTGSDGLAVFELDDRPRIILLAGSFGVEVTAPVMWLTEEYDMDIMCRRVRAYQHEGETLLDSQQVIPVAEAEEYRTKRKEKQAAQRESTRREPAVVVLLRRGVLKPEQTVRFDRSSLAERNSELPGPDDEIWLATVTGNTGRSDNVRWKDDGGLYSFTGLTQELLHEVVNRDPNESLNGYRYWCHPAFENRTLRDLRNSGITSD